MPLNKKKHVIIASVIIICIATSLILLILRPRSIDPADMTTEELLSHYGFYDYSRSLFDFYLSPINPVDMGLNEWLEDFNYFYNVIKDSYPYFAVKERMYGYKWLDLKTTYEDRIRATTNNRQFLTILLDAIQALQNRHTHMLDPQRVPTFYDWVTSGFLGSAFHKVFCEEVVNASNYWSFVYQGVVNARYGIKYDAVVAYDRGDYIIVDGVGSWVEKYGNRSIVLAVNGEPIDEAVKSCYEQDYLDWDYQRNKSYLWMISPRDFGVDAEFTIRNTSGYESNVTFTSMVGYSGFPYQYPGTSRYPFKFEVWENDSTGYFYTRTFDFSTIDRYSEVILNFWRRIEGFDHLIIDIRGNPGGEYLSWIKYIVKPFIKVPTPLEMYVAYRNGNFCNFYRDAAGFTTEVSKTYFDYLPPEVHGDDFTIYNWSGIFTPTGEVNYNGSISLLTDNVVYSAAECFSLFCKQSGFATIYGTTTGGDGILPGYTFYVLPNSKLVIRIATTLGLDSTGHASEEVRTQPDVYYESAFGNFNELIDYVRDHLA
ncbi:MAG: S41 family peptidase [Candidatus Hodarchaeota archaeon]